MNYINAQTLDRVPLRTIREAMPNTSLPKQPSDANLTGTGFAVLHPTDPPAADVAVEQDPEQGADGLFYQSWIGQQFTEQELVEQREQRRSEKQQALQSEFEDRYWTPVDFTLEDSSVVQMQLRGREDQANIETVQQAATALSIIGGGDVTFRMADNVRYTISASHFLGQTLTIFSIKQQLLNDYWDRRDELAALTDTTSIEAFDPAAGW